MSVKTVAVDVSSKFDHSIARNVVRITERVVYWDAMRYIVKVSCRWEEINV